LNKSDAEIWKDFKSGNEEAFCYLYDTYFTIMYSYGRKFTHDVQLVKDCVQDVFTELIRRREKLSDTDNVRYYLLRSIRRRIARRMKSSSMEFEHFLINEPGKTIDPPDPGGAAEDGDNEQVDRLKNIVRELPGRQKEGLFLKYYFGFSNQEIADIMDINYQSVSNLLQKALKKIHESLGEKPG
jgi:RNA polymerase sigma factor (sigma-70 family)